MPTYLDAILEVHRARVADDHRSEEELRAAVADVAPTRGFLAQLATASPVGVIAEVKRRSPSKGALALDLDPSELAATYERAGATCLSVLTDEPHFGGSPADLAAARGATSLPALRKDFTVAPCDLYDARAMGADAALLIVAALIDAELSQFIALAGELGLDALVEVHDEAELTRALRAGASLVGVNQRDLRTFEVDPGRACRVAGAMPDGVVKVAESGIRTGADVARLVDAGFDAILVGEALVTAGDPDGALRSLLAGASAPTGG